MNRPTLSRRQLLGGAGALALIAGCGAPAGPAPTAATGAFPRTVRHRAGETVVPAQPERVAALGDYADLDNLLALGVTPVLYGFSDSWSTGRPPWQEAAGVATLPSTTVAPELNLEDVAAATPDLLVGMPSVVDDDFARLSQIAPTIGLGWDQNWRDSLRTVADAVGREDRADGLIADVETAIAAAAARLTAFSDLTVMIGSAYGDVLYVQGATSPVTTLFGELGLTVRTTGEEALQEYSLEEVSVLADADVLFALATDLAATTTVESGELWRRLPAVAAGRYTAIPPVESRGLGDGFNALSYATVLDSVVEIVTRTAEGRGTPLT